MGSPLSRMTAAQFLDWEAQQPERHEFYRGEIYAMVGGTARHNRVALNLFRILESCLDASGCEAFVADMKVALEDGFLYPDLVVRCSKDGMSGTETTINDPVLIAEILSPGTAHYDRGAKFALYRTIPSLREYVLIDPETRTVEAFATDENGRWPERTKIEREQVTLQCFELQISFDDLFRKVRP